MHQTTTVAAQFSALPLIGRSEELALFNDVYTQAENERGSTLFVTGEAGIGKTRLVTAALDEAKRRGFAVAAGQAFPVETGVPYALFADALLPTLEAMNPETRAVLMRGLESELAHLFPTLAPPGRSAVPTDASEFRGRLLWNFTRFLQEFTARDPLLVLLEDLHWADTSTLELLHFISRQTRENRLVMLGTYREPVADANPRLREIERSLSGIGASQTLQLGPLGRDDLAELLHRAFDAGDDPMTREFAALLYGWTRGNPFFIVETLKSLVETKRLRQRQGVWIGWDVTEPYLPQSVIDVVTSRLRRLSSGARALAELAAVVGTRVRLETLVALTAEPAPALVDRIEELVREEILVEAGGDELVYDFAHPIVRQTLYSGLGRTRGSVVHAAVADALERYYGDAALSHAGELAFHYTRATGDLTAKAVRYQVAAGADALGKYANQEAADYYAAARERLSATDPAYREVLTGLARAKQRLGDYDTAIDLWRQLCEIARDNDDQLGVARALYRIGLACFWSGRPAEALRHYDGGLEAAGEDVSLRVRLRVARAICLNGLEAAEEAKQEVAEALEEAERAGEPGLLARANRALLQLHVWSGPSDIGREHGQRALELAKRSGDQGLAYSAHLSIAVIEGLRGNADGLRRHLGAAESIAERVRSPVLRLWTSEIAIEFAYGSGEWKTALSIGEQSVALGRALNQYALLPRLLVWTALIHLGRNDFEVAKRYIDEAWDLSNADESDNRRMTVHTIVPAYIGRAAYHHAIGDYKAAIETGEAGLAIVDRTGYMVWAIHRLIPIIAESCLWRGDIERARRYGERLRRESQKLDHKLGLAWADACDALVDWLSGNTERGADLLRRAAERLESIPFVPDAARLRRQLAGRLADMGDREGALRELRNVHETLLRLGAEQELRKTRHMFRELGARPPSRSGNDGVAGLTARETEIAGLVAARKSNKAIGRALGISPRTVSTHLSNLFKKLEISSRGELADLVRDGHLDSDHAEGR